MQNSNAVVKKIYCIVINGKIQEKLDFDSTDIIIREVYQNVD